MTPAQHYERAQQLIQGASELIDETDGSRGKGVAAKMAMDSITALAQVHATLATAGAIVTLSAKDLRPDDAYKFLKRSGWYDAWNLGDQPESRQENPDTTVVGDVD